MQGIYVQEQGHNPRRPKSKKEVRELADRVLIESTSVFGNEYEGAAVQLPEGVKVYFVGPDPYTSRRFYGTIERVGGVVKVK